MTESGGTTMKKTGTTKLWKIYFTIVANLILFAYIFWLMARYESVAFIGTCAIIALFFYTMKEGK